MYLKKETIVTCLLVLVLSFVTTGEIKAKNGNGSDVDAIYQSIRNSSPLYEWDESIVTFENEGMTLVCSLTIPRSQNLCPIVVTLNGFLGTRDEAPVEGTDEGILKRTARILAEQGFASLRVDFRGSGESDGDYSMTTFSTQISDTIAALDYITTSLKHQVNTKAIGIIGFSQGGLVGSSVAGRDSRVSSLVLWSAVANPPITYEGLLRKEGIKQGLELPSKGSVSLGVYLDGTYLGFDITLTKEFFEDLFSINPVADISNFKGGLMVIGGKDDIIVWPQPTASQGYLGYHKGYEKMVTLDADHGFNYWQGSENVDEAIYWSGAWFIKTLTNH
jgi:pimeloyl-ACP methyl ester carboxylesterase